MGDTQGCEKGKGGRKMRYIIGKLEYVKNGIKNIEGGSFRILESEEVAVHKDEIKRLKVKCNRYAGHLVRLGFEGVVWEEDRKEAGE
jgi:hypothetical protein